MKATGIVRRIDDLGRVVIPKEIRRTLHIRVGEPLEIYVSGDGEVIFKKYSPLGELSAFASRYAEVLARSIGRPVLVADRDHIIAVSGTARKEFLDQRRPAVRSAPLSAARFCPSPRRRCVPSFSHRSSHREMLSAPLLCWADRTSCPARSRPNF